MLGVSGWDWVSSSSGVGIGWSLGSERRWAGAAGWAANWRTGGLELGNSVALEASGGVGDQVDIDYKVQVVALANAIRTVLSNNNT